MITKCNKCEKAKGENNTFVILNQEFLIMRNKICHVLIKELKGNKVT